MNDNHISPDLYAQALRFAATRHKGQPFLGTDFPYILHPMLVCMEVMAFFQNETHFDTDLTIQVALLHDVIEDTPTTHQDVKQQFGERVAQGVLALSKDKSLPKESRMQDSLQRIRQQPHEIWLVKLADRITNLASPPASWNTKKCAHYRQDAILIHEALKEASPFLAGRLLAKIAEYQQYC